MTLSLGDYGYILPVCLIKVDNIVERTGTSCTDAIGWIGLLQQKGRLAIHVTGLENPSVTGLD